MPAIAYRKMLRHRATIKRNVTSVSSTGASKFNYEVIVTNLPCNVQQATGRIRQMDVGQVTVIQWKALFGPEADALLQPNDVVVITNFSPQETYFIVEIHSVFEYSNHHVEVTLERWIPSGEG